MKKIEYGYTYSDVLLVPQYSEVRARQVDLTCQLTKAISMPLPMIAAAMDTVTEAKMAIAMARLGGFGVIHKSLSTTEQINEIKKVQAGLELIIKNPICVDRTATIAECSHLMYLNAISGIPVVHDINAKDKELLGIVTKRDILSESNLTKKISTIMSTKLITLSSDFKMKDAISLMHFHKVEKLPVVKKQKGKLLLLGLVTWKDVRLVTAFKNPFLNKAGKYFTATAIGVNDFDRALTLIKETGVDALVLDSAHGHTPGMILLIKRLKALKNCPLIIAGNVATTTGTEDLINAGADVVKVGIGPGAACTTRIICGVGYPQLSAVLHCSSVAKKLNVSVIADGGINYSGDIAKALAAGANLVMLGSLFAGCKEAPGEILMFKNKPYKNYRGMGSLSAILKGSGDIHFQDNKTAADIIPEGIEGRVSYKGPLTNVISQLCGGIKSSFSYIGAKNISMLQKKAEFIRLTASGLTESHPHNIIITNDAPNYK